MEEREGLLTLTDPSSSAWGVGKPGKLKAPPALLNWKTVNEKMPWNIVFLLGGGFALAKGSEVRKSCSFPSLFEGDPVAGKEGPCFSPSEGRLDPCLGAPWWPRLAAAGERLECHLREAEETSQRDLSPLGFSKPKGRQISLVGRDCSPRPSPPPLHTHTYTPPLHPFQTENIMSLAPENSWLWVDRVSRL